MGNTAENCEDNLEYSAEMKIEEAVADENSDQILKALEDEIPENRPHNDLRKESDVKSKNAYKNLIKNVNNQVLIEFLSPEISENEKSKRAHKYILIGLLATFLAIQFASVYCISAKVINYAVSDGANINIVNSLLTFVTGYITSVVIELIAILKYIVKNVFDTSLAELVKIFKDKEQEN